MRMQSGREPPLDLNLFCGGNDLTVYFVIDANLEILTKYGELGELNIQCDIAEGNLENQNFFLKKSLFKIKLKTKIF